LPSASAAMGEPLRSSAPASGMAACAACTCHPRAHSAVSSTSTGAAAAPLVYFGGRYQALAAD
ncbi:MAG: hypothetical protein QGF33_13170, partial [Alphaproteobacteria bacterium]|nr:hypothetical protein [Alphaproteobacteria bacterium]